MNEFAKIKRDNYLKKLRSNSIAILTNQIDFDFGCLKMKTIIYWIENISPLEEIDVRVFKDFYEEMSFYPIEKERENYNLEYLKILDKEVEKIHLKYKELILKKCIEIKETINN